VSFSNAAIGQGKAYEGISCARHKHIVHYSTHFLSTSLNFLRDELDLMIFITIAITITKRVRPASRDVPGKEIVRAHKFRVRATAQFG
jgi:hypothetical protein